MWRGPDLCGGYWLQRLDQKADGRVIPREGTMNGYNFTERVRKVLAMAREDLAALQSAMRDAQSGRQFALQQQRIRQLQRECIELRQGLERAESPRKATESADRDNGRPRESALLR